MGEKLKKRKWVKYLSVIIALVIATTLGLMQSCSSSHYVSQSSYNTATGDSIVIKYEQKGNIKR